MAHLQQLFRAGMSARRGKWLALAIAMLSLTACEKQPLPPSPASPSRPQTMAASKEMKVQRAIFNYGMPCGKTTHTHHPQPATTACVRLQV